MLSIISSFGPFVRQYIIVIIADLSLFTSGLGLAWTSPMLVKLADETNPVYETPITGTEASLIVSLAIVGSVTSNLLAAYLVDKLGRKKSILLSSIPRICCYLTHYLATAAWMNYVARILGGFSDGISYSIVPMYASEIASKEIRGALGTLFQIFSAFGILLMMTVGPFMDYYTLNMLCLVLCVVTVVPILFIPDSPYFLHKHGNKNEAIEVLKFLRPSESEVKEEILEYEMEEEVTDMTIKELCKTANLPILKVIAITVGIGVGSQITGFNALALFLQTILASTNSSVSPEIASVIIGVIQLVGSFFTASIIDRFGRKPILSTSIIGVTIGMIGLGTFFYKTSDGDVYGFWNYLPLISIILADFSFSSGVGCLMFPLMAELFDGRSRAIGMSFGVISCFTATFSSYSECKMLTVRQLYILKAILRIHRSLFAEQIAKYSKSRPNKNVLPTVKLRTRFAGQNYVALSTRLYNKINRKLSIYCLNRNECKTAVTAFLLKLNYSDTECLLETLL